MTDSNRPSPAGHPAHAAPRGSARKHRWGLTFTLGAALLAAGCGASDDPDLAPVAVAGIDQRLRLSTGGTVEVVLDGALSFDPEGAELQWRWRALQSPNGLTLVGDARTDQETRVPLSTTGLYVFELVVTDGVLDSAPDHVNVLVVPADRGP